VNLLPSLFTPDPAPADPVAPAPASGVLTMPTFFNPFDLLPKDEPAPASQSYTPTTYTTPTFPSYQPLEIPRLQRRSSSLLPIALAGGAFFLLGAILLAKKL
jgi:hypothetical protein